MGGISPQLQHKRNIDFLNALEKTGNPTEAAKLVGKIGSQGAKNPKHSAEEMGRRRLRKIEMSILDAALAEGVTPHKVAKKINKLLDNAHPNAIDKGITQALKVGVGGGYAPEKHVSLIGFLPNEEEKERAEKALEAINESLP